MTIYSPSELEKASQKNSLKNTYNTLDDTNPKYTIDNSKSKLANNFNDLVRRTKDKTLDLIVDVKDAVVEVLEDTKIEIYTGIAAGAIILGVWSYNHEATKNKCLRLSFSEISQIERQGNVSHMTEFLAKTNDFYMKVFEAHNDSWNDIPGTKDNTKSFARALDRRVDPTLKIHHYELPQLNKQVPQFADSLLSDLNYIRVLQKKTQSAVTVFDKTWDDYHNDSYHTEVYYTTETSTDANGNTSSHMVMHTRQVYDYTDNTYKYYKNYGEQASSILNDIKSECPKIKTDGLFMSAAQVGEENRSAIEQSRKLDLKDTTLTDQQYLEIANMFITGSRQYTDLKRLEQLRVRLVSDGDTWRQQKNTAQSYSQRTYNYSHAKSKEFLTCEDVIETGNDLSNLVDATLGSIESTKDRIPKIMSMVVRYIDIYSSKENVKEAKKLKKEILSESKEGYYELFNNGVPLEPAKWWHVILLALGGAAVGGAIGKGWDFVGDNTNLYNINEEKRNKRRREREEERYRRSYY